jgi:DinB superfamily
MDANLVFKELTSVFEEYKQSLNGYSDANFSKKQSETIWSLGQMYEHVCASATLFFLANVNRCLDQRKGQLGGEMTVVGQKLYDLGAFPPQKITIPDDFKGLPIIPKSKNAYVDEINRILEQSFGLLEKLQADQGLYTTQHPIFGALNANQWFKNLEMHTRHHLRQKAELEGYLVENDGD